MTTKGVEVICVEDVKVPPVNDEMDGTLEDEGCGRLPEGLTLRVALGNEVVEV